MKIKQSISALVLAALLAPACIITTDDDSFIIQNDSSYAFYEIYLTERRNPDWGPNLLRGDVLLPGESFEVVNLGCDTYDALIVDEIDAECELRDIDVCFNDAIWFVDNSTLSFCDIFQADEESDEAK